MPAASADAPGALLRDARRRSGLTQAELARRARAARRVGGSRWGVLPGPMRAWADSGEVDQRVGALMLAGNAGARLAGHTYMRAIEVPATREAAVYALGMYDHPLLTSLTADPREDVAGAARWWLSEGPRVTT